MVKNQKILRADPQDFELLTQLTLLSKAYWGYTSEQMTAWHDELKVTPEFVNRNAVFKLCQDADCIAYYAYIVKTPETVHLESLFVLPEYIDQGVGKILMEDFLARIKKQDFQRVTLEADPNAEFFYEKYGFEVIGKKETTIPGRHLPLMQLEW